MKHFVSLWLCFLFCCTTLWGQAWKGEVNPALPALKQKAEQGDPAAMAEYAFHSLRCMGGVKFQPNRIFDLFTQSAEAGNAEGQVGLAHCYCFSVGTMRDVRKAEELIREPFAEGHPVALKIMGYFYFGFHGVKERDLNKVKEFNEKSAAKGCVAAKYNLAIGYTQDRPEKDVERGMNELRALHDSRSFPLASAYLFKCLREHQIWVDHEEVYQDCVQRISEYAKMDEPSALYRLGVFHEDAGDLENAVGCYAQSAHLGNGNAYYAIWRINHYRRDGEYRNVWAKNRDRGNLALRAYQWGTWNPQSLAHAGWEITRVQSSHPQFVKRFPDFEKDAIAALKKGECDLHDVLGRLYCWSKPKNNPEFVKPEWGKAHLLFHTNHTRDSASILSGVFFSEEKTTENLARGYACSELAAKRGHPRHCSKKHKDGMKKQMTPEAMKRAEELMEQGYPSDYRFRKEAEDFLIKIGHLPPRR